MIKNDNIHTGDQLKLLFPYQFSHPAATFAFYRGWMPIVAGLCLELDTRLGGQRDQFYWMQMKEKFGSARLYYALGGINILNADIHQPQGPQTLRLQPAKPTRMFTQVDALVLAAQEETKHACMVCGAMAQTRNYAGYWQTLCADHNPEIIGQDVVRTLVKVRSSGSPTLPHAPQGDGS